MLIPHPFFSQIAGNAVKKASDNLVRAAQKAAFDKADDDNVVVKTKFVGGIAQVIIWVSASVTKRLLLPDVFTTLLRLVVVCHQV